MTPTAKALLALLLVALVVWAWMYRLDAQTVSSMGTGLITDRILGRVYWCNTIECVRMW